MLEHERLYNIIQTSMVIQRQVCSSRSSTWDLVLQTAVHCYSQLVMDTFYGCQASATRHAASVRGRDEHFVYR